MPGPMVLLCNVPPSALPTCRHRQRLQYRHVIAPRKHHHFNDCVFMDDLKVKMQSPNRRVWNMHVLLLVDAATKYMVMIEIPTTCTKCCVNADEDHWFRVFAKAKNLEIR